MVGNLDNFIFFRSEVFERRIGEMDEDFHHGCQWGLVIGEHELQDETVIKGNMTFSIQINTMIPGSGAIKIEEDLLWLAI